MLHIAICDDSPECRQQVLECVEQWPDKPEQLLIRTFEDADSLLMAHGVQPFDIILMDVIMPLLSGIEAARELRQTDRDVKLIFLTSSRDFAVESYTVKADNYLLKPLQMQQLHRALTELTGQISREARSMTVKGVKAVHRVPLRAIEYVEAQNKRVLFVLSDGRTIESNEPLYTYEPQLLLSDGFFKCSRSYIVNINRIEAYTPKEIRTQSGCRIAIARSHQKDFETAYFDVMFGKVEDF